MYMRIYSTLLVYAYIQCVTCNKRMCLLYVECIKERHALVMSYALNGGVHLLTRLCGILVYFTVPLTTRPSTNSLACTTR